MSGDEPTRTISVSREALRADLAELELRLRTYLDAKLELKANAEQVVKLSERVDRLASDIQRIDSEGSREAQKALQEIQDFGQGKFTDAFKLALGAMIQSAFAAKSDKGWKSWQRVSAVLILALTVATVTLAILLAVHNWSPPVVHP